jgi:hypothetical protein
LLWMCAFLIPLSTFIIKNQEIMIEEERLI